MTIQDFEQAIGTVGVVLLDRLHELGKDIRAETDEIGRDGAATDRLNALRHQESRTRADLALHLADTRAVYRQQDEGRSRPSPAKYRIPF